MFVCMFAVLVDRAAQFGQKFYVLKVLYIYTVYDIKLYINTTIIS